MRFPDYILGGRYVVINEDGVVLSAHIDLAEAILDAIARRDAGERASAVDAIRDWQHIEDVRVRAEARRAIEWRIRNRRARGIRGWIARNA